MSFVYNGIIINNRLDVNDTGRIITTKKAQLITDNGSKTIALDDPKSDNQVLVSDNTQDTGLKWTNLTLQDLGVIAGDGLILDGNELNIGTSNTISANADNIFVKSSSISNQPLLSGASENSEAVYGALPLNDVNAVTGILSINNGGTGTNIFNDVSSIISTNSDNSALITTGINPNDIAIKQYIGQTINNVPTIIHSIPTSNDTSYSISAVFIARKTTSPFETASFKINALFNNISGNLELVDNALDIVFIPADTLWKADIRANSSNIIFSVSGSASTTIIWKVIIQPLISLS